MRRARPILIAVQLLCAGPASAETVGLVLMHGKQGMPQQFERMANALEERGYVVERPEMCWSRQRIYDLTYLDCFRDIDAAIVRLKARGAGAIVIAGQSLGGNGALGYGARHDGLKGIIALAPAHAPQFLAQRPEIAASLSKARDLIADGKSSEMSTFTDVNTGPATSTYNFEVTTTPAIYVSFFAPDGPTVMGKNAAKLTAPLLMISGDNDPTQRNGPRLFAMAPPNSANRLVQVEATHLGTPAASFDVITDWLKSILP
jgi:esterase/lipase